LGLAARPREIAQFSQFGFHGYQVYLDYSHIEYLVDLNTSIREVLPEFDRNVIARWKLVNDLLVEHFARQRRHPRDSISRHLAGLAALAAFPILEEVARQISGAWDEEGMATREVIEADGVTDWKPDGTCSPHLYKKGKHRIVILSHKLQLMQKALDPEIQKYLDTFDKVFQQPMIMGNSQAMSPLYERLEFFRNQWVHGRRYEGWEALLVSFILGTLYFGHIAKRKQQDNA